MSRAAGFVLLLLSACVATPPDAPQLEQARAVYEAARADPEVAENAPAELELAGRALADTERAAPGERTHRAYLAEQRARIARETAHARLAERESAEVRLRDAEEARDRAQSRAREVEEARDMNDRLAAQLRRLQAQVAELQARETERGWILTLAGDLLFDVGRASLKPGGRRALANLARFMREHPERKIVIEGFTDDRGPREANQRLSERRAAAVRDALVQESVEPERIAVHGYGGAYPVASNDDAAGRQLNRRVEILIGETVGRAATGGTRKPGSAAR
ncbi:MAG: OmpA family protein [Betaproteobacteria bacterium]|nr:OmpA family protein [Betaproteobacteria bacterium]